MKDVNPFGSATNTKTISAIVVGCVALVALIYLWAHSDPTSPPPVKVPSISVEHIGNHETEPAPNPSDFRDETSLANRASSIPPLPDSTLQLSEQLPVLLQRADSGDPIASCRLIVSINRCREERRNRIFTEAMMRSLSKGSGSNDNLMVGLVASSQESQERKGSYCDGVETSILPEPEDLFQRAINGFTTHQKTVLAMMRSDGSIKRLNGSASYSESGMYVMPQFLADNTVDFLMSGYSAKDRLALEGLVMLHSPGNAVTRGGVSIRLPNPKLFLFYSHLMLELYGAESIGRSGLLLMQVTESTMTPKQLDEIRRRVAFEATSWKNSSTAQPMSATPNQITTPELAFKACG